MIALPTWDLFITIFFIIGMAYGIILQRDKVVLTLISVYVALVVTAVLNEPVQQFFVGDKTIFNQIFVKGNVSPFAIQAVLFAAIIALVSAKSGLSGQSGGLLSPIEVFVYSFLTTGLIISSIFTFLPEATQAAFTESSRLAALVLQYHLWWVILPVVMLIAMGFLRKE